MRLRCSRVQDLTVTLTPTLTLTICNPNPNLNPRTLSLGLWVGRVRGEGVCNEYEIGGVWSGLDSTMNMRWNTHAHRFPTLTLDLIPTLSPT